MNLEILFDLNIVPNKTGLVECLTSSKILLIEENNQQSYIGLLYILELGPNEQGFPKYHA